MSSAVQIRDIDPSELLIIRALHEKMDIGYEFPNLTGPLFAIRKAIMDEHGNPVAAAALKLTSEAFLWIDPDGSPYEKTSNILRLAHVCHERAKMLQIEDVTAWVPPQVEATFGEMLSKMGWTRSPWASWSARI